MLMHHSDIEPGRVIGRGNLLPRAPDVDFPLIRLVNAEEHTHQGGFTRPVLPQKGEDFTLSDPEGNVVVGHNAGKALGDMAHFHNVLILHRQSPPHVPAP
ncbi:hypothetical protein SDC9_111354 [bioreactor metagenome]|uniref:Uncharacterized protein n=1 Tax=bioreactor metagenome TaxID=1076179 RepID=A0A645BH82_9ZZZZ